jgi:uncharacterized protein (TIGR03435 family)
VLRDRFDLVLHAETKELPVYALKVAKNGPELPPPAHPGRIQTMNINNIPAGRRLVGTTATMDALAQSLQMVLGRPVHDETGLSGRYDFTVEWSNDMAQPAEPGSGGPVSPILPSIFTALSEELGLRIESPKRPVPIFVIDRIKPPSVD